MLAIRELTLVPSTGCRLLDEQALLFNLVLENWLGEWDILLPVLHIGGDGVLAKIVVGDLTEMCDNVGETGAA